MSTKAADKLKCESEFIINATEPQLVESSVSLECTIKLSEKFFQIFQRSHTFSVNKSTFNKKQIKEMETKINNLYNEVTNTGNAILNDVISLAYSYQNLCHGYIKTNQKEDLRIGKNFILRCLDLVKDKELGPKSILIALKGHYQLGFIYFNQKKTEKAVQICNKGIELYLTYIHDNEKNDSPIDFENIIIESPPDGYSKLKGVYKCILELLIDANTNKMSIGDHNVIVYKHLFLAAELSTLEETGKYFQWVEETMKIFIYLLKYDRFTEAKNHIKTAFYVRRMFSRDTSYNIEKQKSFLEKSKFNKANITPSIPLFLAWPKYDINLFRASVERLLRLEKDKEFGTNNLKLEYPTKLEGHISQRLLLFNETVKGIPFPDNNPPEIVKYISNYNDAYQLFAKTIWNIILTCYDNDDMKLILYLSCLLESSKAYKYMAFYEKDVTSRSLLAGQRVDLLLKLAKNEICLSRRNMLYLIRFELVSAYSTLIHVKFENLDSIHPLYMPHRFNAIMFEIEYLVRNALENLKMLFA